MVSREGYPLCLLKLCWFDFSSSSSSSPRSCGATRGQGAGTLRRARCPLALPGRWAVRRGPPGRTCHSPRSRARRERGRGGGASFLSETYGIRQEFGPPRFKKTNKGKIVREGPPRAAGPPHCPPHSPSGRPGSPGGGGPRGWGRGGLPRVVPGGLSCPGPRPACHPPLPGDEEAAGRQGEEGASGGGL